MGPGDLPDGAKVAGEGGEVLLLVAGDGADGDDLDGAVGGGSGQALAIVVHRRVVDEVVVTGHDFLRRHFGFLSLVSIDPLLLLLTLSLCRSAKKLVNGELVLGFR